MADAGAAADIANAITKTANNAKRVIDSTPIRAHDPSSWLRRCFRGFCSRPEFSSGTIAAASAL
jgi:hypothetical protein